MAANRSTLTRTDRRTVPETQQATLAALARLLARQAARAWLAGSTAIVDPDPTLEQEAHHAGRPAKAVDHG